MRFADYDRVLGVQAGALRTPAGGGLPPRTHAFAPFMFALTQVVSTAGPLPSTAGALQRGLLTLGILGVLLVVLAVLWWRAAVRSTPAAVGTRPTGATSTGDSRLRSFLAARLSWGGYLGLHLTLGLALSAGALALFAKVADDLLERDDLALLDARVAAWFAGVRTPGGLRFFYAVTQSASPAAVAVLGVVAAVILIVRRRWLLLAGLGASLAGGSLLDTGLKLAFHRARPEGAMTYLHRYSWSFPSGHAAGAMFGFGFVAYLLALWARRAGTRALVIVLTALYVLAVATSRLYLGVHYLTDVVGGLAAGAAWLAVCVSGVEAVRRRRSA